MKVGDLHFCGRHTYVWMNLDEENISDTLQKGTHVLILEYVPYHFWRVLTSVGIRYIYKRYEADEAR